MAKETLNNQQQQQTKANANNSKTASTQLKTENAVAYDLGTKSKSFTGGSGAANPNNGAVNNQAFQLKSVAQAKSENAVSSPSLKQKTTAIFSAKHLPETQKQWPLITMTLRFFMKMRLKHKI